VALTSFLVAKTWVYSKVSDSLKTLPSISVSKNMKGTCGFVMAVSYKHSRLVGGAHPFSILDWTVVHNGELSSYGTNRRYLEMYGYNCTMQTDTEVLAYTLDLLRRRQRLPLKIVTKILAPPLWDEIDMMEPEEKKCTLR